MGCEKMLRELDLTEDKESDDTTDWKKAVDDRPRGGGSIAEGGGTGDDLHFDDLLDIMDSVSDFK